MAKVGPEGINCPSLREAADVASKKLFDSLPAVYGYYREVGENNHLTTKGTGRGKAKCKDCGKCLEVILTMRPIEVVDPETGKSQKVYDKIDGGKEVYILGGTKCSDPSYPNQR